MDVVHAAADPGATDAPIAAASDVRAEAEDCGFTDATSDERPVSGT